MAFKAKYLGVHIKCQSRSQFQRLTRAFELLERYEPKVWRKSQTLRSIEVTPRKGYDNELFPDRRIWQVESFVIDKNPVFYIASLLLHETFHLAQFDRGVRNIDGRAEKGAYSAQAKFLYKIGKDRYARAVEKRFLELAD